MSLQPGDMATRDGSQIMLEDGIVEPFALEQYSDERLRGMQSEVYELVKERGFTGSQLAMLLTLIRTELDERKPSEYEN